MQNALCIRDIVTAVDPIAPNRPNSEVYDLFHANPDLVVLGVVDRDGQVCGLVERHTFNLKMAAQYGRALFGAKPVSTMMETRPLLVDIDTRLHDFTALTLQESPSQIMRGFIATAGGRYQGVGTSASVLAAISQDLRTSLERQESLTQELMTLSAETQRNQIFLDTVIQNIPAMVLVKNASDQKIVLLNRAGESLMGMDAVDVLGKTPRDIFRSDIVAMLDTYDRRALDSKDTVIFDESHVVDRTGAERVVQLSKTVLRTPDGIPDSIITLVADMTEQKKAEAQIARLAHYDPLTGLANRALFARDMDNCLSRAQRTGRTMALMCLDLDRFKAVNDSHGHLTGDQLLIEVAARLRKCVRKGDSIARLGGDEFAVIQDVLQADDARHLAGRIVEAMAVPFTINGITVDIGVSVGVALAPDDGLDANNLLSRADMAMYRVKSSGRNGWCFYQPEMDEQLHSKLALEIDLKTALRNEEFELHFQPLLDLDSGEIVSFETLLRWRHPQRGLVSPAEFIPLAEDTGLIAPIGEWVLKTACRTAQAWPKPWRVAVNISPIQFRHKSLVKLVARALSESGLDAARLELEITESVILTNETHNLAILNDIRAMGAHVAMDDFGTGYSSLSYLRSFPFDKLKIDQSFIRDLPDDRNAMSIVRAITEMAQSLGVKITAEGVETEAQMAALRTLNCREAQGYLIGRPSPDITPYIEPLTVKWGRSGRAA